MKKILLSFCAAIAALAPEVAAEVPDSVYVYLYTNVDENVRDGLHWAWSADSRSDYSLAARRQAVEGSVVLPPYSFVIIRYDR